MRIIFWVSAFSLVYTYLGYVGWLWIRRRWYCQPVEWNPFFPFISIVMVVRNEGTVLEAKLRNLKELNYPSDLVETVVVSDGSTDETNCILAEFGHAFGLKIILNQKAQGKASGINDAVKAARGEVVVFTDVRQQIEKDAVRLLMENFADRTIGCASGELLIGKPECGESTKGMGLYWKIEKSIREMESACGSVAGATGALYAVRRNLIQPLPPGTILDDVFIPMHVLKEGSRVVFDSRARAWDTPDLGMKREFARKVRTLTGNYQLLQSAPWLLGPVNPIWFEFFSHKIMRLFMPFALAALLITAAFLPAPIYRFVLILQLSFYGLSLWGLIHPKRGPLNRLSEASLTFVLLNTAAAMAFANFLLGRKVAWGR
jgi:poly-beta-1,6-N-acetyl-D-glucosamine synthase